MAFSSRSAQQPLSLRPGSATSQERQTSHNLVHGNRYSTLYHGHAQVDENRFGKLAYIDSQSPMSIDTPAWVPGKYGQIEPASLHSGPMFVRAFACSQIGGADSPEVRKVGSPASAKGFYQTIPWTDVTTTDQTNDGESPGMQFKKTDIPDAAELTARPPQALPLPSFVVLGTSPAPDSNSLKAQYGSAGHAAGTCKPCAHFWRSAGCSKGDECERCHLCDESDFKRYREGYRKAVRAQRRARRTQDASD